MVVETIVYYADDCGSNGDGSFLLKNKNIPLSHLGDGIYLFREFIEVLSYIKKVSRQYNIYKLILYYEKEEYLDLDNPLQYKQFTERLKELWSECEKAPKNKRREFKNRMEFIGFLVQLYKEVYSVEVISISLRDSVPLYRVVKREIPIQVRSAISNKKLYCVSNADSLNMIKKLGEN